MDFWNWKDTTVILAEQWPWLLLALLIGIFVGWWTCESDSDRRRV
jgi:hypothetical protein